MIRTRRIFQDYAEAGSLDAHVSVQSVVDDRTMVTSRGHLLTFLKVEAPDPGCLDPVQLDHVTRVFERAVRPLDSTFRVYQYVFKRNGVTIPSTASCTGVVGRAIASRTASLNARSEHLYQIELFFMIAYTGWQPAHAGQRQATSWRDALRNRFSAQHAISALGSDLERASRVLAEKVDTLTSQVQDAISVSVLTTQESFRFLRRLLNYAPHKADVGRLKYPTFIARQAADSAVECHQDHLRIDDYYAQVLSLKEPPSQTFANLLQDLLRVPGNAIVVSEWQREDNGAMRQLIDSKRRHFHHVKTSLSSQITATPQTASRDVLTDHSAVARVDELGECLTAMEMDGRHFGRFSLTIVLYDLDRASVQRSVVACQKVFAAHDASLIEERYNILNAWLAAIPGNDIYNRRRLWVSSTNYADLSFLFAPRPGHARNPHLAAEYLAIFETPSGVPFYFNLHFQDVGHAIVLGATGSGKSFLINALITHFMKYGPFTFVLDLGGSYRTLTEHLGGAYTAIGHEGSRCSINPFQLDPTPTNLNFLNTFVRALIESTGYRMTSEDERDLRAQIANVYEVGPDERRLLTLANIVKRPLRLELEKWVEGGPYAQWFDNRRDDVSLARFHTFDLEGLAGYPQVLEPLLFYILHRASASILDPALTQTPKLFVLDEAWRFFRHPEIKLYVTEALKTWRKKNASMLLVTQSLDDLRSSELLAVAVESCPTKLFLANPGMDRSLYRDVFHLNETETDHIANLTPKKQVLIKQPDLAKVVDLNVDPLSYWLYTTNIADRATKLAVFAEHGLERGLDILATVPPGQTPGARACATKEHTPT